MRVALVWTADSDVPAIVTDSPVDIYSVDERHPDDRVYKMGPGINRVTDEDFDRLIAGQVYSLGDKPVVEQAILALLNRAPDGKAGLTVVDDGKCAGGEVPPLDGSQCAKCGATENDNCPYEKP